MTARTIDSQRADARIRLKVAHVVVGAAFLAISTLAGPSSWAANPSIFNSVETRKEGLKPFPKWTDALQKYFAERKKVSGGCEDPNFNRCHYATWTQFIDSLRGQNLTTQLDEVNKYMNRHKYIVDPVNWGVKDYWESPGEFFDRFGDCEDYSISKYLTLLALGVDPNIMRIFIVMDMNLKVAHAILAVYVGGEALILDNQLSIVVDSNKIRHYKPIFSVNETGWWKHKVVKTEARVPRTVPVRDSSRRRSRRQ